MHTISTDYLSKNVSSCNQYPEQWSDEILSKFLTKLLKTKEFSGSEISKGKGGLAG